MNGNLARMVKHRRPPAVIWVQRGQTLVPVYNILANAGEPAATITYGAGTVTNPNNYADNAVVAGAGIGSTILNGHLDFGSGQEFRDMTIQATNASAIWNKAGASGTTFRRCHFRGGGGSAYTYVISLGSSHSCDHITFLDCEVERNLGTEAAWGANGFNNVCIWCGHSPHADLVSYITFDGCHLGVSNGQGGHDTGAPRFNVEYFSDGEGAGDAVHGWSHVTFNNCVVEAADMETMDFSDQGYANGRSDYVTVTNCTIKGGGYGNSATALKNVVNFEMPLHVVFTGNTVYKGSGSSGNCFQFTPRDVAGFTGPAGYVDNNVFDFDYDNGITMADSWTVPIMVHGSNTTFTNNTIRCHHDNVISILRLDGGVVSCTGNTVTGNTVHKNVGQTWLDEQNGATGNTTTPNTVGT